MKNIRIIALILVILVLGMFLVMSGALLMQNYNLFFIAGSVLIALLLLAFLLLRYNRKRIQQEAEEIEPEELTESAEESPEEEQ